MKLAKLSLAAIVALGVSAFADVQNIKVSGDAKLFYATSDEGSNDLFEKQNAAGQAAVDLAVTADLSDGVKGKLGITMLNTLGLEKNLVNKVWDGGTGNQWWVNEAWLAKTFSNTTIKVGRQELDTPFAFTEKWSIAKNTFDAAVLLNSDLPNTTLVGAFVGRSNSAKGATGYAGVVRDAQNGNDSFTTFGKSGAFAFAAVTKVIPMTTAQVWYYDVIGVAQAWWLQADIDLKEVAPGLSLGLQYAHKDPDEKYVGTANDKTSKAWAVKLGYGMENLKLSAAYSKTDKDGYLGIANAAGQQSKLYTEAWWNYGYVGKKDTTAWMVNASYNLEGVADLYAQYTNTSNDTTNVDMSEFTVTATKSFGNLDATLAYILTDADDQNSGDSYSTVQVYLTYNF